PLTVLNFMQQAKDGFYDGLRFHRVVPNFVAQGGDPRGDGWGGPNYFIRCEYTDLPYKRGTVGIATSGKDTGGSQFFITLSPQPHLEARYSVFGQVVSGMKFVDDIVIGDTIDKVEIQERPQ
ncbi:MAG: peptidylprolyl isomerase, partial [Candidatus Zixiibacteriota bacterium]